MTVLVERVDDLERSPRLRAEWDALQSRASGASLFTSPGWLECWLAAFGSAKAPCVLAIRDGGELVAVAPLIWSRVPRRPWLSMHHMQPEDLAFVKGTRRLGCVIPIRQLGVAGNLQSGNMRGELVALPAYEEAARRALFEHLGGQDTWDVMCLPGVRSNETSRVRDAALRASLRVGVIAGLSGLYELTVRPWPDFMAVRSRHFRKRLRESEVKLRSLGEVREETATEWPRLTVVLDETFALARQSWKEQGERDASVHLPMTAQGERFYRDLAHAHARSGRAVLVGIRLDGALVAALLAVRHRDVLYLLQTFYAPSVAAGSPGRFLMRQLIEFAAASGIRRIDTNGNSGLARMFGDESQTYDQVFVFRRRGYSGWLYRVASVLERLRARRTAAGRMPAAAGERG
jgi:CelD/BcsL family acetyltransferase involved in cellulose biosynthesis